MTAVLAELHEVAYGGVRLHLLEKRIGPPGAKPAVVLAHGSTTPGTELFDLRGLGKPATSLADALARAGLDVFVPDVRGFGRSTLPEAGVGAAQAADDLCAVVERVTALVGAPRVALVGFSWGCQVAARVAAARPKAVARLALIGQVFPGSPGVAHRRSRLAEFSRAPWLPIAADAREQRFRAGAADSAVDPEIATAFARAGAAAQPRIPTGPQRDVLAGPWVDPVSLRLPTLMLRGAHDEMAEPSEAEAFFAALPAEVKRQVVVPDAGHFAHLHTGRELLQRELAEFLLGGG